MIAEVVRGLGFQAFGDPPPAPGSPRGLSYSPGLPIGRIKLVASGGRARERTYREVYYTNPFVYAATNYIARGIGRLPLHLYELDSKAEKTRIRGDIPSPGPYGPGATLDRALNIPQGRLSRAAFFAGTTRSRMILGNALWEIERAGGAGIPIGLTRVPMSQVQHIEEDSWGNISYYEILDPGTRGQRRALFPTDVVHFGLGNEMEGGCGSSLLESCSATLALHDAILRHLLAYMENSATPSGSLYVERVGRERAKEIRDLMTELYASPENAGRILVTSGKWQAHSDSPDHAKLVELIKESRIEIAAAFQIPPPILGLLENAIRANVKELREQFGRDGMGPWASEFESEIDAQLIKPVQPFMFSAFQLAEQLRPDIEARAMVYQRMMFILSIDEIRGLEDLPPLKIKGVTDVPWVQSGAMPLTTAAQPKAPVVRPPSGPPSSQDDPNARALSILQAATVMSIADDLAKAGNGRPDYDEEV
jgi:HK97 family phage portal protein